MAAISASLFTHGRNGIVCVGDLYGGTQELLTKHFQPLGIPVTFLLQHEPEQLAGALNKPGMLVYCETPANPTLGILDIKELAEQAHANGGKTLARFWRQKRLPCSPAALEPCLCGCGSTMKMQ